MEETEERRRNDAYIWYLLMKKFTGTACKCFKILRIFQGSPPDPPPPLEVFESTYGLKSGSLSSLISFKVSSKVSFKSMSIMTVRT